MFDDILKLLKNTPRWNNSALAQRLGLAEHEVSAEKNVHSSWTKLDTSGPPPTVRSGHTALVVDHTMYIFGGYNEGFCHDDLYAFDLIKHHWSKVDTSNGISPDARASHSWCASSDNTKLYLFGGSGPHWGQTNMGKLLQFDLTDQNWTIVEAEGQAPPPGYGQSMCAVKDKLVLFGGTSGHVYVNDLYVFDIKKARWTLVQATGSVPSPRYKHQSIVHGDQMYVFGGGLYDPPPGDIDIYCLDVDALKWEKIKSNGDVPCSRIAHSAVKDTRNGHHVFLFGGRDHTGSRLNDLSQFDLATHSWVKVTPQVNQPDPRDFHSAAMQNGEMFVFGGSNGRERSNQVFRYRCTFTPSSLVVLTMKEIQLHSSKYSPALLACLPPELAKGIELMNADVCTPLNISWG